ncbi:hypothetical protein BK004_03115 [bacterium CG10_46_32]|nr:MAG: hypothetical protein BK004_03115 [bacterium CG10_46_32]PIR55991.1 MAG: hypothetical protein COU73_03150 [Parcubacteria group bacterium CG10_big_fil_rev_8_21_14_0_10_46_32]
MQSTHNERTKSLLAWSASIAVFWVVFLWGFWNNGPFSLGINAAVFLLLVLGLLGNVFPSGHPLWSTKQWHWLVPFLLIALSYALYATPFIKIINIPVVPVLLVVFVTYALLGDRAVQWGWGFVQTAVVRGFVWLGSLAAAARAYSQAFFGAGGSHTVRRAIAGVVLLLVIVVTIVLPLLASADIQFKALVQPLLDFFGRLVEIETLWRVVVGVVFALIGLAVGIAWSTAPAVREGERKSRVDSIVSGIVVGGIFLVYALFLAIQIKRLWVAELPIDFSETEELVKSGFWQLFFLSIINGIIFLAAYAKTNTLVQRLLAAFTVASLLLVFSAAWRMALYVVFYGFSSEKFFAAYTVIFSIILFAWLVFQFVSNKRLDLVKFGAFLFLWMYALVCIFPVEQFIMRANVALSHRDDSRIVLSELTMLSSDVLGYVEARQDEPMFENWGEWIQETRSEIDKKAWYEATIVDMVYNADRR